MVASYLDVLLGQVLGDPAHEDLVHGLVLVHVLRTGVSRTGEKKQSGRSFFREEDRGGQGRTGEVRGEQEKRGTRTGGQGRTIE